jgi:lipopolysaccharide transport system permease protein
MSERISVNDAGIRSPMLRWSELVAYRDFLSMLVWRELHLRYRHTLIGAGWSFLNPFLTMLVFSLIVPNLVSRQTLAASTGGVPYAAYVYCGMAPWACFSHALTRCNMSLVDQSALLRNMYFPRLALPLSCVLAALTELLISLAALAVLMAVLRVPPSRNMALLPLFFVPLIVASLGAGLILAMVQVRYRDVFFLMQFGIQLGLLVTPVWFPLSALHGPARWVVALNPMTAVVQGFRWAVFGIDAPSPDVVAISGITTAALLWVGLQYFRARQETVADHV